MEYALHRKQRRLNCQPRASNPDDVPGRALPVYEAIYRCRAGRFGRVHRLSEVHGKTVFTSREASHLPGGRKRRRIISYVHRVRQCLNSVDSLVRLFEQTGGQAVRGAGQFPDEAGLHPGGYRRK